MFRCADENAEEEKKKNKIGKLVQFWNEMCSTKRGQNNSLVFVQISAATQITVCLFLSDLWILLKIDFGPKN